MLRNYFDLQLLNGIRRKNHVAYGFQFPVFVIQNDESSNVLKEYLANVKLNNSKNEKKKLTWELNYNNRSDFLSLIVQYVRCVPQR